MTKDSDALKSLIKQPKTAEHYAYNVALRYGLSFKVQSAIEHLLLQSLEQYSVPYHALARMLETVFYQQRQDAKVRPKEDE